MLSSYQYYPLEFKQKRVKLSNQESVEAHTFVSFRESHIL
jgi:hypothetical protein